VRALPWNEQPRHFQIAGKKETDDVWQSAEAINGNRHRLLSTVAMGLANG
jgi:hypothetical protein